jgi:probable F420-dependent oxidoreductase
MAHPRRFRFGIMAAGAATGDDWVKTARKVEDLGYASLMMPDHFGDQLAPMPALTAAAAATTELRVGALVLDNDYRHPVLVAKEAATLDLLSGGRLELGLGAGWMNTDYQQSGISQDPAGVRIDRMAEAVIVLKGLFADGEFSYAGRHYAISGLNGRPKPVQQPHVAHRRRRAPGPFPGGA